MLKIKHFKLIICLMTMLTLLNILPASAQEGAITKAASLASASSASNYSDLLNIAAVGPIVFESYLVDDDNVGNSTGNNNGTVECGETIELFVNLLNGGTDLAATVDATLSTSDPYVTFIFNSNSAYPDLTGGTTGTNVDDYDLSISAGTPNGHVVSFDLNITAAVGGPWTDSFEVPVSCGPKIQPTPASFNFIVPPGGTDGDTLTINNIGVNVLDLEIIVGTDPDLIGDWVVYYDWDCDGNRGTAVISFFVDHTFSDSQGGSGIWDLNGSEIVWTYPIAGVQYTGLVAGSFMTGTMVNPVISGCWDAGRELVTPLSQVTGERTIFGEPAGTQGLPNNSLSAQKNQEEMVIIDSGNQSNSFGGFDLTTGSQAINAAHANLNSSLDVATGGNVLWDLTHGIYFGYEPNNSYSSLVTLLNSAGFSIYTTDVGLDNIDLAAYDIIVVNLGSSWSSVYSPAEVTAIVDFVNAGGGLLVMGDNPNTPNININPVSQAFGCTTGVSTISPGGLYINNFSPHSLYAAITEIYYLVAGEVTSAGSSSLTAWGAGGEGVVCIAEMGAGRAVVLGDINLWENSEIATSQNQLFAENVFIWLSKPWLSADPVKGTIPIGGSINVQVGVDAMDMAPGIYHGGLAIKSNDPRPDKKLIIIPVTMRVNAPPNTPLIPIPADGSAGVPNLVNLEWTGGDLDPNDTVTYDVYFDTNNPPVNLICDDIGVPDCDPGLLLELTLYYWQVIAKDDLGVTSPSVVWQFKTGGNTYLPLSLK